MPQKNPIFLEIFGSALKSCTKNSQAGFILMFWTKFVNVASIADGWQGIQASAGIETWTQSDSSPLGN